MFYTKAVTSEGKPVTIALTPDNVYTLCKRSREIVHADVAAFIRNGCFKPGELFVDTVPPGGLYMRIFLTEHNVYHFCDSCGKAQKVDLSALNGMEDFDLNCMMLCKDCSAKHTAAMLGKED